VPLAQGFSFQRRLYSLFFLFAAILPFRLSAEAIQFDDGVYSTKVCTYLHLLLILAICLSLLSSSVFAMIGVDRPGKRTVVQFRSRSRRPMSLPLTPPPNLITGVHSTKVCTNLYLCLFVVIAWLVDSAER
jgi:hypothetical protein